MSLKTRSQFRRTLRKVRQPHTGWLDVFPAVLGKANGTVQTGTPGEIYVRNAVNGQVVVVHNNGNVPSIANLQVEVGRRIDRPSIWQIKGQLESYNRPAGGDILVGYHADQHRFPEADTVWVDRKQVTHFTVLVSDAENFIVQVYGGVAVTPNGVSLVENQAVDLSSYVPTSGAKYVSLVMEADGALTLLDGTEFSARELAAVTDIPLPGIEQYLLAFVLLYEAQESLSNNDIRLVQPFGVAITVPEYLDDLLDVEVPEPTDGQVLTFDSYSQTWIAADPSSTGGVPIEEPTATNDFLVGEEVATVWTWVKKTFAQTITILRASLDAIYAPIANGVTNGDSHDHVGGDGASLAAGIAAAITAGDSKNPPVGADSVAINDTEASNVFKRVTLTNMRTFFKTTYDTLYASISHTHGGSGGLTYTATTVTTGNVTGVNGNLYVCTIDGMTADRDLNLPTPAAAGERIGVLILDGDDTYELIIKANSVEITRLFIANEYMTFVSTGTGAADWEIEIDGRIACIALVERQAVQSINDSTTTKILLDAAPTNRGNMADVTTNDRVDIRRGGIYNVSGQTSIENLDDTEFINASLNIDGVANVSLRFFNGGSTNIPMVAVLPTKGYTFTAGQYLELYCRHNEGAAQNTGTGGNTPFLYVQEVLP